MNVIYNNECVDCFDYLPQCCIYSLVVKTLLQ